jgi:putative endonuclease
MSYCVYLLASNKHGTLYVGVTRDLIRRVYQHRTKAAPGFTSRYGVSLLVWFSTTIPTSAITREKEIKKWQRDWNWTDLYPSIAK